MRFILDECKGAMSLEEQKPSLGGPGLVGGFLHADGVYEQWLTPQEAPLVQRFDPSQMDTIGFFIAKFRKRAVT